MEHAIKIAVYVLECIFAIGIIGSAIVVALTSIEDSEVFFSRDREQNNANGSEQASPQEE